MPNVNIEVSDQQSHDIAHTVVVATLTLAAKYLWRGFRLGIKFYKANKDTEMTIHVTYGKAFWVAILVTVFCLAPCVVLGAYLLKGLL